MKPIAKVYFLLFSRFLSQPCFHGFPSSSTGLPSTLHLVASPFPPEFLSSSASVIFMEQQRLLTHKPCKYPLSKKPTYSIGKWDCSFLTRASPISIPLFLVQLTYSTDHKMINKPPVKAFNYWLMGNIKDMVHSIVINRNNIKEQYNTLFEKQTHAFISR